MPPSFRQRVLGLGAALALGALLLAAYAWLPEPPLRWFFRAHGITAAEAHAPGRVWLRVRKSAGMLEVRFDNRLIRSFACSTGPGWPRWMQPGEPAPIERAAMMAWFFGGDKQTQGDFRTPEGQYQLVYGFRPSNYHRFALISYPDDAHRARSSDPGGSVGLHGMIKGSEYLGRFHALWRWTRGCVALTNRQVDELAPYVGAGTKILIEK